MIFAIVSHGNNGFHVGERSEVVHRHCGHMNFERRRAAAALTFRDHRLATLRLRLLARRYAWPDASPIAPALFRAVCRLFAMSQTPRCKRVGSLLPQPIGSARDRRTIIVNPVGK